MKIIDDIHQQELQIENALLSIISDCKYHDVTNTTKQRILKAAKDISKQTPYSALEVLGEIRTLVSCGCSIKAAIQITERKLNPTLGGYSTPITTGYERR